MKTAAEIFATNDIGEYKKVFVPEWDTDVCIRPLTAREVDQVVAYEKAHQNETDKKRAYIIIKGACNEDGTALFKMDEMNMLVQKSFSASVLLSNEIMKHSGLMKDVDATDDADAEKN
jgi:hypothetical protein